jgi:protein TonB
MFEDSFVESQAAQGSTATRWTMAGSTALQVAIAAALVALPLLHPERLNFHVDTPLVFTLPLPKPPIRVVQQTDATSAHTSSTMPTETRTISTLIPHGPIMLTDDPPSFGPVTIALNGADGLPSAITGLDSHTPRVSVVKPEPPKRVSVSSGVSAGMLLSAIRPAYPAIAKAAGVSGTVVVEAVISKAGTVESLRVLSGPDLLRAAALDAIRAARYHPYLLNGDPIEVQTTFTVNFKLGA